LKKIEEILTVCIEDIRAGRSTLEECLTQYSDMRSQLEPLLRLAVNIHEPPAFKPSTDFKVRARVQLMDHIHSGHRREPWNIPFVFSMKHAWRSGWLKTSAIVLAVVLIISASGTGTAYASQDSLPGDSLYPVKMATENFRRVFTLDEAARVELELTFMDTRLEEIGVLVEKNPGKVASAIIGYKDNVAKVVESAERAGAGYSEKMEMVARVASKHISAIDDIHDEFALVEAESLQQAANVTLQMQLRVLGWLAEENPIRAMEINIETMHNRLKRAAGAVDKGMITEAENALGQFQEMYRFGEKITQSAKKAGHDTVVTDALYAQAASEQNSLTGRMHGKAHGEEKPSPQDIDGKPSGNHGMSNGNSSGQGPTDDMPAASDNQSWDNGDPQEEPGAPPSDPGNPPENPGQPPATPQGPGSPPEKPGNGGPGKD
jgi:hypothetical protein